MITEHTTARDWLDALYEAADQGYEPLFYDTMGFRGLGMQYQDDNNEYHTHTLPLSTLKVTSEGLSTAEARFLSTPEGRKGLQKALDLRAKLGKVARQFTMPQGPPVDEDAPEVTSWDDFWEGFWQGD